MCVFLLTQPLSFQKYHSHWLLRDPKFLFLILELWHEVGAIRRANSFVAVFPSLFLLSHCLVQGGMWRSVGLTELAIGVIQLIYVNTGFS